MSTYSQWLKRFKDNDLLDFTLTEEGRLWLKLRAIDRKVLLSQFVSQFQPSLNLKTDSKMECLWQGVLADKGHQLNAFLKRCQDEKNAQVDRMSEMIRSNLYKMEAFHWGGGFRNSLDKAIVSRFVKTKEIVPYDHLECICKGDLLDMSRGYLMNSWYNYWSSVLIENVFRHQPKVVAAPGEIKNVDFFVDDVPFDLKVTYFPKEFAKKQMRAMMIDEPLKRLNDLAKREGIPFAKAGAESQRHEIEQRIVDSANAKGLALLQSIRKDWNRLVAETMKRPYDLVKWLYEEQGDMRFGAENRIFLILVDWDDERESWKLKRNIDLIQSSAKTWVNSFCRSSLENMKLKFNYEGKTYQTFADAIFICKGGTEDGR